MKKLVLCGVSVCLLFLGPLVIAESLTSEEAIVQKENRRVGDIVQGDYTYTIMGQGKVSVDGFSDDAIHRESVIVPEAIEVDGDTYEVVKVWREAFSRQGVREVSLPNVTEIGYLSFDNNNIDILDAPKVEIVRSLAFSNNQLTSLDLPDAIKIDSGAFANNPLRLVNLPSAEQVEMRALASESSYDGYPVDVYFSDRLTNLSPFVFNGMYISGYVNSVIHFYGNKEVDYYKGKLPVGIFQDMNFQSGSLFLSTLDREDMVLTRDKEEVAVLGETYNQSVVLKETYDGKYHKEWYGSELEWVVEGVGEETEVNHNNIVVEWYKEGTFITTGEAFQLDAVSKEDVGQYEVIVRAKGSNVVVYQESFAIRLDDEREVDPVDSDALITVINAGRVQFDEVASDMMFDSWKVGQETSVPLTEKEKGRSYIQLKDTRKKNTDTWEVTSRLSDASFGDRGFVHNNMSILLDPKTEEPGITVHPGAVGGVLLTTDSVERESDIQRITLQPSLDISQAVLQEGQYGGVITWTLQVKP